MSSFNSIEFKDGKLILINQTLLPLIEEYIVTDDLDRIAEAIEKLEVRGAPAIGVAAAYGLALAFKKIPPATDSYFMNAYSRLASTRPTAVNLFWALDRMKSVYENNTDNENLYPVLLEAAKTIHKEDADKCAAIADNGLEIFEGVSRVVTHCNTGKLATGGDGTALNVIKAAFKNGLIEHVYADETRPLLQGSRLTAFELEKAEIPFSIITDSTAAFLMRQGKIDIAVVGADRIASNGDTANKIGTYNLAVICRHHGIPFYVAAPDTTLDRECPDGESINIELRGKEEVVGIKNVLITRESYDVYTPAFDITPHNLINGIITDTGIYKAPYNF